MGPSQPTHGCRGQRHTERAQSCGSRALRLRPDTSALRGAAGHVMTTQSQDSRRRTGRWAGGPAARWRVPCSELSDKAASASAAAMPLVGSGLSSTGRGSRGASAFSVCSAPGGWGEGTRGWIRTVPLESDSSPGQGPGGGCGPGEAPSSSCLCPGWNRLQSKPRVCGEWLSKCRSLCYLPPCPRLLAGDGTVF